jgi:hypothetical protein
MVGGAASFHNKITQHKGKRHIIPSRPTHNISIIWPYKKSRQNNDTKKVTRN